jgi:quercetin dioxygenase-like cupin family protein
MEPLTTINPVVLTAEANEALPVERLDGLDGVSHRVLWRNETSMAGVLTVAGGHRLGKHSHRVNHHHIWVLDGQAVVLGHVVSAGSYVHIPSGVDHDIDASASAGCTVFYMYLRPGE